MSIKNKAIIAFLSLFVAFGSLNGASFNCKKAGTFIEHTICNDDKLSKLDEDLAKAYKSAKKKTDKNALKKEQRKWLKTKRKSCQDVKCLRRVYTERVDELNAYGNSSTPTWAGRYHKGDADISIENNLSFMYVAMNPAKGFNMCNIEGKFSQQRDTLSFSDGACSVKIKSLNNSTLSVKIVNCDDFCGNGIYIIDGKFKK